ncbi:MAG: NAD(P)/FAD-dependent oxidoreductase [Brevundimonas sp.]|nr:MAG: NAD(P)/FAD-dependent oxidoreductase [Brevundimonas sp.]
MQSGKTDVVVIGAGPAGSLAAALLARKGLKVEMVERTQFPRFSIGESLLAQSLEFLGDAGLLDDIEAHGFQFKDGVVFERRGETTPIYFPDKSAPGRATTFQVMRSEFDDLLAKGAVKQGAVASFGQEVIAFESNDDGAVVTVRDEAGEVRRIEARFVLDASGFGRTLSKLCDLETPSDFPTRRAVFGQVKDNITAPHFDRNKILVSIHPTDHTVWYWLIPLANGISSIGVVGPQAVIEAAGADDHQRLWNLIAAVPHKEAILKDAEVHRPAATITGYACNVKSLHGPSFALLGNAAEFLDPVFSSGVTIAFKSATLAAGLVERQLNGEAVDWETEFSKELYVGIDTFRECVDAWYTGALQTIIFNRPKEMTDITRQLTSVLAGYAWDRSNIFVKSPKRTMRTVEEWCST